MARKRMFCKTIVDSDLFLDMPLSTQALYFHLGVRADDEGFINNPKRIMRTINSQEDDLNLLILKGLIIKFDTGIMAVTHWLMHNTLKKDRFHATACIEERAQIDVQNKVYVLKSSWIQNGNNVEPQYSIDKISIEENREEEYSLLETLKNEKLKNSMIQFIEMRKSIGKPITSDGLDILYRRLMEMTSQYNDEDDSIKISILEYSIVNSYKDIYEPKNPIPVRSFDYRISDNNSNKEATPESIYDSWCEVNTFHSGIIKDELLSEFEKEFYKLTGKNISDYHKTMTS